MYHYIGLFLLCCLPCAVDAKPLRASIKAPSAIVINANTGAILYEKNSHQKKFPASLTKIATALYVLEKKGMNLDQLVIGSKDALHSVSGEERRCQSKHPPYRLDHLGSSINIKVGEKLSRKTLLYGLLLSSGNDAANVLAEDISGNITTFVKELNAFLKKKGIVHTHFVNPHGLHHSQHWTTAYDMAQIARYAYQNAFFRSIVQTTSYTKPSLDKEKTVCFIQTNKLLQKGRDFYPRATGMKTGYTSHAGYTLVASAQDHDRTLIAVLLGCKNSQERFEEARKLFDIAFAEPLVTRTLFAKDTDAFTHVLPKTKSQVIAHLKKTVDLTYYPAEEPIFHVDVVWDKIDLPIEENQAVGFVQCVDQSGAILRKEPIFASAAVMQTPLQKVEDYFYANKRILLTGCFEICIVILTIYLFKKFKEVRQR